MWQCVQRFIRHLNNSFRSFCGYQAAYFKCFPFFFSFLLAALFPLQHRRNIVLPREQAGGQLIVYTKKKKWVQSKTQLLHPEGHLGASTGVPHSYWSGCSGTVGALHDVGPQQTGTPRLCPTLAAELQKTETSTDHQGFFKATEHLQH